jgi:predicted dehydrogenase
MLEKSNKLRIKVAMIGGGINSAIGRVHEIAMKMDCRFELVAGCFSRNPEINLQSAEQYGVSKDRVYGSLALLLAHEAGRIDAVVVATPIQTHYEQILAILEQGLRVISDKPLVDTPAQCVEIRRRSKVERVEVYCMFNYTGYPAVREMRQRVRSGAIGKVFKVMAEMPQDSYLRLMNQGRVSAIQNWRLQDGHIACVTLDLFVHLHSLVGFICEGRPEEVTAFTRSISGVSSGLIDEVDAFIRYDNTMQLNAWYSKVALGYRNGLRLRVLGTKGSLQWHQEEPETLIAADSLGNRLIIDRLTTGSEVSVQERYQRFKAGHPSGFIEAFANYYFDIAEAIESGKESPWLLSFDQVEEGLRVAEAIHKSARDQSVCRVLA